MQISKTNYYKQNFGANEYIISNDVRDFAEKTCGNAQAAFKRLSNVYGGNNRIFFDKEYILPEFKLVARKQPKTLLQKLQAFLRLNEKSIILEGEPSKRDITKATLAVLRELA